MRFFKAALYVLSISLLALFTAVSAQSQDTEKMSDDAFDNLLESFVIPSKDYTETEGTPYFNHSFETGSITFASGSTRNDVSFKYNTYEDHLEISFQNKVYAIPAEQVSSFVISMNDKRYHFRKGFDSRGLDADEFVLVLSDGPVMGLLKHDTSFQQAMATYGTSTQKDEYIENRTLYVHQDGSTDRVRRLRERNILNELGSHKDELERYIQVQNLDLENTDHLINLFTHYNELLES